MFVWFRESKSCRRPVVSLLYASKPWPLCWACALASLVTFLAGDHVMQIGFGQISPSASSTRDLGTRLGPVITKTADRKTIMNYHTRGQTRKTIIDYYEEFEQAQTE